MQDLVPPLLESGMFTPLPIVRIVILTVLVVHPGLPHTLAEFLSTRIPLLFPEHDPNKNIAYALVQGVVAPPEAEMAWLGACMSGADGWVNVCVGILRNGKP